MDSAYLHLWIEATDLLTRYARAVDARDWDLYRTVFAADARIDYSTSGGPAGDREAVIEQLEPMLALFSRTQHYVTNMDIRGFDPDGGTASVSAMFYNPLIVAPGKQFFCGGWYHHELVRTPDGWRSVRLVEEAAWFDRAEEAFSG
ncbi:nuclear transport factor 2 family protein [Rhodococcus sp. NPDC058505]|uniref:nuclear transport factor 2 family protein n=1 Tax=unclassified Rhodococcus (in: high G+C Gram-positive bacteria) TaxID=192944 RepID=UPI00364CDC8E